jgi:hypothetical protein
MAFITDHALTEIQNERILLSRNPQSVQYEVGMKRLDKWEAEILDKQLEDNADALVTFCDKCGHAEVNHDANGCKGPCLCTSTFTNDTQGIEQRYEPVRRDISDWDLCCKVSYRLGQTDQVVERSELLSREITATKAKFEPPLSKDEEDLMWAAHYEQQMQQEYEAYSYEIDNEA